MSHRPHIFALGTALPPFSQSQGELAETVIGALPGDERQAGLLRKIYRGSHIERRYSVVQDYMQPSLSGPFFGPDFPASSPGMSRRNEVYKEHAPGLAHAAAEKALAGWGRPRTDITHVISVSCTGLMAPGIEFMLVDSLGLQRDTERLGINFMGCFGAFKGLAVASALAMENPDHRVLVVCTELCSLHFHLDGRMDTHVANAIFSDGAAAVVVGAEPRPAEEPWMHIVRRASLALESTRELMSWEAADEGLVMRLSQDVPAMIDRHVAPFVRKLLGDGVSFDDCDWAVHPGGKAILEVIAASCQLKPEQTAASWQVMRSYGNMSSATFLFVLERQWQLGLDRAYNIGLGFGPGLSVEGVLLEKSTP